MTSTFSTIVLYSVRLTNAIGLQKSFFEFEKEQKGLEFLVGD
tara:strand:+ start:216 stop:341 length:126 start_codon:yes stop_codon:yes gene_type:complete